MYYILLGCTVMQAMQRIMELLGSPIINYTYIFSLFSPHKSKL